MGVNTGDKRTFGFFLFNDSGTYKLRAIYSTDGTFQAANDVSTAWTPSTGVWYHVAVVFTAATPKIQFFVDGAQQGGDLSPSGTSLFALDEKLHLGSFIGTFFDGILDDVRIWSTVRSGAQISANMSVELTGAESGLVAYYPFEAALGTPIAARGDFKFL